MLDPPSGGSNREAVLTSTRVQCLREKIRKILYTPRVPTSPEMRVYRGGVSVPVSVGIYPREYSPCPHVPRNESV